MLSRVGFALFPVLALVGVASATITIPMVQVGNAGNAADPATGNVYGSVGYSYNVGQFDVTAGQYTAFLNAVASTGDPMGLYNSKMTTNYAACGINQTPISGGYKYSVDAHHQNYPVNLVSWGDAARFCNWLSNGQPTGNEGNGTTETGSYTLNGATDDATLMTITRNAGANYVIPTRNEWYKAAYYDPALNAGAGGYWLYPTRTNDTPSNVLSATGTNNANFFYTDPTNYLTPVGAFASSPSAYNTFDQGGDVLQWNEASIDGSFREARGGSFLSDSAYLASDNSVNWSPSNESADFGFRISQVPEPASLAILALGISGMLIRRRGVRR